MGCDLSIVAPELLKPNEPEVKKRKRDIIRQPAHNGLACDHAEEEASCNEQPCPINCEVGPWMPFSLCDQRCGNGTAHSHRTVVVQPRFGGKECPKTKKTESCKIQECPSNCLQTPWTAWGPCSKKCGGGRQSRSHKILKPPQDGGRLCEPDSESRSCNTQPCDAKCEVSQWNAGQWNAMG